MSEWCGNDGKCSGIGKSLNDNRCLLVSMCRERYALLCPFGLPKAQFPPMRSDVSNVVYGTR